MIDLAEFVSDYVTMLRENGERRPETGALVAQIADAYIEAIDLPEPTREQLGNLMSQIDYYLS